MGVGLRVADSHTGNHREDDFTLLETILRFLNIIWEKIPFDLEWEASEPKRRVTTASRAMARAPMWCSRDHARLVG
ncbi:hypothetical protein Tco_1062560 [Tanacetum coccineum]